MAAETITEDLGIVAEEPKADTKKKTRSTTAKKKASAKRSTSKRSPKKVNTLPDAPVKAMALPRELTGLICLAIALAVLLSILSFTPADLEPSAEVSNLIGPVGARIGDWLLTLFGLGAFCFDALFWYIGCMMLVGRRPQWRPLDSVGQVLFVLSGTMLAHLSLTGTSFFGRTAGGFIGEFSAEFMRGFFGTVGAYIIVLCLLIMSMMFVTNISLSMIARAVAAQLHKLVAYAKHQWRVHMEYRARLREEQRKMAMKQQARDVNEQAKLAAELAITPIGQERYQFEDHFEEDVEVKLANKLGRLFRRASRAEQPEEGDLPKVDKAKKNARRAKKKVAEAPEVVDAVEVPAAPAEVKIHKKSAPVEAPVVEQDSGWTMGDAPANIPSEPGPGAVGVDDASSNTIQVSDSDVVDIASESKSPEPVGDEGDFGPRIVESEAKERARRIKEMLAQDDEQGVLFTPIKRGDFELPKISFLNYEDNPENSFDIDQLRKMAAQIEQTLRDFKVEGSIRDICPGPVITVFEFSPAPGVKISKIANLSDDLAMALSALSVRIVAPIPGKGVVGIEVPNPKREIVFMKEIIADKVFYENKKMALPMGLGKDTAGNPVVTDLAKMPHLLVAGATGSGKSVAVNTMITSLLYKNSPDDVRMIMVDPKMLEFSIYADIPHLLLPVVTDPKKATAALNWAVQEMEQRYQRLADLNVRNIKGYNQKVEKLTAQAEQDMNDGVEDSPAIMSLGIDAKGQPKHKHLPYIVVIIDEFADLMMTASKDVETAVARLAQKARAAGIHLILATQRPSTDVITGLIKANFPTRIALRVTSKTDSRVILDSNGAENLLGMGDMLFVPPGTSYVQRVHGAYVSEDEIEQIVDFLKSQGTPEYNEAILASAEEDEEAEDIEEWDRDEHYADAVRLVVESKQASISMIQRKLRVGYNRAARMVEMMEKEGLVSAPDGCRPREVLISESPY